MGKSEQGGGNVLLMMLEQLWAYTGALSSVAVFAGVLGLGVLHVWADAEGRPSLLCYSGVCNPSGNAAPHGVGFLGNHLVLRHPHVQVVADAAGRPQSVRQVDAQGALTAFPGSRVAEQRVEYDAQGRVLRRRNLNADGLPAADAHGVSQRVFEYNAAGRLILESLLGTDGKPLLPKYPGYARCRRSYDAQGRPLLVRYLDAADKPVVNAAGESRVEYLYDDAKGIVTRRNMVHDVPTNNAAGYAMEIVEKLPNNRGERRMRFNAGGLPVLFHPAQDAVCEHLVRHNERGHLEWECYAAADGLPAVHPDAGYAERVCEYTADGKLQREWFWNEQGQVEECCERHHTHSSNGEHHCLSLFTDGHTEIIKVK